VWKGQTLLCLYIGLMGTPVMPRLNSSRTNCASTIHARASHESGVFTELQHGIAGSGVVFRHVVPSIVT
jgi:hypothetical protein